MNPIRGDLVIIRCCMFLFCLLFSSCTKQKSYKQKNNNALSANSMKETYLDTIVQQEAMLTDIPIPLFDARIIPSSFNLIKSDTLLFGYKSPLSYEQAIDFFLKQMERLGWKHLVTLDGEESLLEFKSPDRYCTIVVKRSTLPSCSLIFIYIKKRTSTDACP